MKVTAFCGSPREGGNTEVLLKKILQGAASTGAETVFRSLNNMQMSPCQACDWCKNSKTEFCRLSDEMQTVYRDIRDSDAVVIGSPVYMWQMTAQTKIMTDRLYGTLLPGFNSKVPGKKLYLVFSQAAPEGSFDPYINSTGKMFSFLKFDLAGTLTGVDTGSLGSVGEDQELMERAFQAGIALAD